MVIDDRLFAATHEVTDASGTSRSRTWRWLALVVVVICGISARRYLGETSPGLRPLSRPGIEGFLRYAWGDYAGAARSYREHLRDFFGPAGLHVDNVPVEDIQEPSRTVRPA